MIFQDPRAHINPVRTIGDFMTEALRTNRNVTRAPRLQAQAVKLLDEVGIDDGRAAAAPTSRTSSPAACCSAS